MLKSISAIDDDGRVIGSANTHPNHSGPGAHVANAGFVVHPARRQEGVGRALCRHVLDQAREDGYRAMQFNSVVETNTSAIRLWRSFGFQILATDFGKPNLKAGDRVVLVYNPSAIEEYRYTYSDFQRSTPLAQSAT